MDAWFVSDIHLKSVEERNGKILLRFLRSLLAQEPAQTHLFLLGDIFDLWVGGHQYFAKKFQPLIEVLSELKKAGTKITFVEGNHDVHIEGFFRDKLGIEVFVEAQYYEIDGVTVRVEHGDLINLEDLTYLKYRSFIRSPWIKPLSNIIPGAIWSYVGNRASKKSRSRSSNYAAINKDQLLQMIRRHGVKVYLERPFDLIVSGHMHVFEDSILDIADKSVRSINLGSWYEKKIRVFRLSQGLGEWIYLPEPTD